MATSSTPRLHIAIDETSDQVVPLWHRYPSLRLYYAIRSDLVEESEGFFYTDKYTPTWCLPSESLDNWLINILRHDKK